MTVSKNQICKIADTLKEAYEIHEWILNGATRFMSYVAKQVELLLANSPTFLPLPRYQTIIKNSIDVVFERHVRCDFSKSGSGAYHESIFNPANGRAYNSLFYECGSQLVFSHSFARYHAPMTIMCGNQFITTVVFNRGLVKCDNIDYKYVWFACPTRAFGCKSKSLDPLFKQFYKRIMQETPPIIEKQINAYIEVYLKEIEDLRSELTEKINVVSSYPEMVQVAMNNIKK